VAYDRAVTAGRDEAKLNDFMGKVLGDFGSNH